MLSRTTTPRGRPRGPAPAHRRAGLVALLVAALLPALAAPATGHYVSRGIGSAIVVVLKENKVLVTYDIGFGAIYARNAMLQMDTDRDFNVSEEEAQAYRKAIWEAEVAPHLEVLLNDSPVPARLVSSRTENLVGEIATLPFDMYYELEVEVPYASQEDRRRSVHLEIRNRTLRKDSTNVPVFYIPFHDNEASFEILDPPPLLDIQSYIMQGRSLKVSFDFAEGDHLEGPARLLPQALPAESGAGSPPDPPPTDGVAEETGPGSAPAERAAQPSPERAPEVPMGESQEGDAAEKFLEDAIQTKELGLWTMLVLISLAFFYGMGHALTPGHGKAMVAAYLVGTKGRVRDAVLLGGITTFTHTFSIFLLGLLIHFTLQGTEHSQTYQNWAIVGYSILGSLILVVMGLVLFSRRVRWMGHPERMHAAASDHHHGLFGHHHHHHSHDDADPKPPVGGRTGEAGRDPEPERGSAAAGGDGHGHGHHHDHGRHHGHGHGQPHGSIPDQRIEAAPTSGVASPTDELPADHAHAHGAPVEGGTEVARPSLWELLWLGIAGGIVPCPGGMTVLAIGLLYPERFLFALFLILVFSFGLGVVLIAIGVLLVTGRAFLLDDSPARERVFSYLPALSALFITGLGTFYLVQTFLRHRPELAGMLSALADWIGGG